MDNIGPAILLYILIIHGTNNVDPPADIPTDGQRNAALERLTDGDAIALMLITMEGIGEIASQGDGGTQLDVAEDAHLMAHSLQGPGLVEAELTAIGRKERRYLEYMHNLVESGEWREERGEWREVRKAQCLLKETPRLSGNHNY
jgi:hypothetical protein